eukprot:jgi/Psemu1/304547/fgenesh1_kg.158_\
MCKSIEQTTSLYSSLDNNNDERIKDASSPSPVPSPPRRAVCRARTVTFCQSDRVDKLELEIEICPVPSLWDMTDEDIRGTWYTDQEFRSIRRSAVMTLKRMIMGTLGDDFEATDSTRGLENKTPAGSRVRKDNRYTALWAVLLEQNRQRRLEQPVDSDQIAYLYKKSNAQSQIEAIKVAASDARLVHGEQEQEQMSRVSECSSTPVAVAVAVAADPVVAAPTEKIQSPSVEDKPPKKPVRKTLVSPIVQRPSLSSVVTTTRKTRSRRRLLSMMN